MHADPEGQGVVRVIRDGKSIQHEKTRIRERAVGDAQLAWASQTHAEDRVNANDASRRRHVHPI